MIYYQVNLFNLLFIEENMNLISALLRRRIVERNSEFYQVVAILNKTLRPVRISACPWEGDATEANASSILTESSQDSPYFEDSAKSECHALVIDCHAEEAGSTRSPR